MTLLRLVSSEMKACIICPTAACTFSQQDPTFVLFYLKWCYFYHTFSPESISGQELTLSYQGSFCASWLKCAVKWTSTHKLYGQNHPSDPTLGGYFATDGG